MMKSTESKLTNDNYLINSLVIIYEHCRKIECLP